MELPVWSLMLVMQPRVPRTQSARMLWEVLPTKTGGRAVAQLKDTLVMVRSQDLAARVERDITCKVVFASILTPVRTQAHSRALELMWCVKICQHQRDQMIGLADVMMVTKRTSLPNGAHK